MIARIRYWRDLADWLPSSGDGTDFAAHFEAVPLNDFLRRISRPIEKAATSFESLNVIEKISFGGILHVRNAKRKNGYKGPLFRAEPGELVFSKIRVGQGSLCIVPNGVEHLAVSPEYPVYSVDSKQVLAPFLNLLLRAPNFQRLFRSSSAGNTTKKRVSTTIFETLSVPLPNTNEQEQLLAHYDKAVLDASLLEDQAKEEEKLALTEFEAALGLTPPPDLPHRLLQIARFKDIERWSHEGILYRTLAGDAVPESRFETVLLEDVARVTYGLQKCPANRPGRNARPYLRVANVQRGRLDLRLIKLIEVPEREMAGVRLEVGDILLCEGNSSDLVGRGAIWKGEIPDCVHQNHVLKVRVFDKRRVLPEFLLEYINCSQGQAYFRSKAKRTTNLASINSTEVGQLQLPIPPTFDEQLFLLKELRAARETALRLRTEAANLRAGALSDFLNAVFH